MKEEEVKDDATIRNYYSERSREYDLLYEKKERQEDLAEMGEDAIGLLSGKKVLEVASGTGYWTELLALQVESITAVDTSPEMTEVARGRTRSFSNVTFVHHDAYSLETLDGIYEAAFCGYWISHVHRGRIRHFLESMNTRLKKGAVVVLFDNRLVKSSVTPVSRTDSDGNTYQKRKLLDGREFEILKNFLTKEDLMNFTEGLGVNRTYKDYEFYWLFHYNVA